MKFNFIFNVEGKHIFVYKFGKNFMSRDRPLGSPSYVNFVKIFLFYSLNCLQKCHILKSFLEDRILYVTYKVTFPHKPIM